MSEKEEKKVFSLRTKTLRTKRKNRPVIGAPKQISGPIQQSDDLGSINETHSIEPPQQQQQLRPQLAGGKTSDLVKRRYSTRFNALPTDFDAGAPVPSLPLGGGRYGSSQQSLPSKVQPRGAPPVIDIQALRDPSLEAEQYVSQVLADATEHDIDDYQQSLKKIRNRTSVDLQQNVYQNRTQFIKISKEAEKLKDEMRALRNLMSELKTNTTALRTSSTTANGGSSAVSNRSKRSSIADRTALWNLELQVLWKNVVGSQKFLPATPGRHVIQETGHWYELDNATWKPRKPIHIVLLNDHLLIATRKKLKSDVISAGDPKLAPTKVVADSCWPLLDIEMMDLSTGGHSNSGNRLRNAIMVKVAGQESFTYSHESPDGSKKAELLSNFQKAVEELRKEQRLEIQANNRSARDRRSIDRPERLSTLGELNDLSNMLIEVDGTQQNLRWVEGQVDELDIDIALQGYDEAVFKVESLKKLAKKLKNNLVAQDFINSRVDERAEKLSTLIRRELIDTNGQLHKTSQNVKWLMRLGYEDVARESYLHARSEAIHKRSRQCIFAGNLHQYIWEISFVYFRIIRNTVSTFHACFPTSAMSACVKWAKEQVELFNDILNRQLSSCEQGSQLWTQCMNQALEHANMLSEVGLNFSNLVGREKEEVK